MCDQQRLRSACVYAQSDQSLCYSLEYSISVRLLTEHHLEFLRLKGGCTGSSESTLVKMPHCWKSHVTAQFNVYWDVNHQNVQHLKPYDLSTLIIVPIPYFLLYRIADGGFLMVNMGQRMIRVDLSSFLHNNVPVAAVTSYKYLTVKF